MRREQRREVHVSADKEEAPLLRNEVHAQVPRHQRRQDLTLLHATGHTPR
jgi:hypothetical protein